MHRPENIVLMEAGSESTTKNDIPRNHRANYRQNHRESRRTIVSPCAKGTNNNKLNTAPLLVTNTVSSASRLQLPLETVACKPVCRTHVQLYARNLDFIFLEEKNYTEGKFKEAFCQAKFSPTSPMKLTVQPISASEGL